MSHEQPPPHELIALAFVVESSLHVAHEWRNRHIYDYCINILRRITETHTNIRFKLAFVSYATADTVPSPILARRFFYDFQTVLKDMNEDISRFGVGATNSGGSRGMAALEGIIAALELFDILQTQTPPNARSVESHIIHIAGSAPDPSTHPLWNNSTALDDVGWDNLPAEIKKRNIQFSTLNLRPKLPRYSELHAATVSGGTAPWFPVRAPHTLLLAPFASPPHSTTKPNAKRANEPTAADRSAADTKRARLQPNPNTTPTSNPNSNTTDSPKSGPKSVPIIPTPAPSRVPVISQQPQPQQQQQPPQASSQPPQSQSLPQIPAQISQTQSAPTQGPSSMFKPDSSQPTPGTSAPAALTLGGTNVGSNNGNPNPNPNNGGPILNPTSLAHQQLIQMSRMSNVQLLDRFRALSDQVKTLEMQIKAAKESGKGHGPQFDALMHEYGVKKDAQIKFGHTLNALKNLQQQQQLAKATAAAQQVVQANQQKEQQLSALGSPFSMNTASSAPALSSATSSIQQQPGPPQQQPQGAPGPMGASLSTGGTPDMSRLTSGVNQQHTPSPAHQAQLAHARSASTASAGGLPDPNHLNPNNPNNSPMNNTNNNNNNNNNPNAMHPPTQPQPASLPLPIQLANLPPSIAKNPAMQAQFQKMFEQQQQQRRLGVAPPPPGGVAGPSGVQGVGGPGLQQKQQQAPPQQQGGQGGPGKQTPVWHGTFKWGGQNEMTCFIVASSAKPAECHAETWPSVMQIAPTAELDVPLSELQAWLKRHQPALCTFQMQPTGVEDPRANDFSYRTLVNNLHMQHRYATASWTLPGGTQPTKNVLIFPINNVGLAGAFFPAKGLPELPKRSAAAPPLPMPMGVVGGVPAMGPSGMGAGVGMPIASPSGQLIGRNGAPLNLGFELPQQMVMRLNMMEPDKREEAIQQLVARRMMMQEQQKRYQQQQQQHMNTHDPSQPTFGVPTAIGAMAMNQMNPMLTGMMQQGGGQQPGMIMGQIPGSAAALRMNGVGVGVGGGVGVGPGPGPGMNNVSYDIMQSFMQRNGAGDNNGGMGGGGNS